MPGTGRLRFIEVKGRVTGADTITVTKNEILYSLNKPDDFILAIVEFLDDDAHRVHYVRRPFQREPDFGVTSVNYDFAELLDAGASTRHERNGQRMTYKKKLIEVALPLEAINKASAREKSIRHGHPSTLHLWWARRPLAAARAVIFAQMVDDPSAYVDVLRADPKLRRKAETALKARLKLWEEARTLAEKAKGTGLPVPEPGPAPTSTTCWPTRSASGCSASSRTWCCGRTPPTRRCCRRRATRSGRAGGAPAPRTPTIRGRRSCSTGTSCPPSTTRSPAAARCRSRRSGWGWRATPAT